MATVAQPRPGSDEAVNALDALVAAYVDGRLGRGEITATTAEHFRTRLRSLAKSFADRPAAELDRLAIDEWRASIGKMAVQSRKSYLSAVAGFCRWLTEQGVLQVDPCLGVPGVRVPRRPPRALPADKVVALLAVCKCRRDRAIILLMVGLGLRRGEVAGLQTGDYDRRAGTVWVKGKNGDERIVPITAEAAVAVDEYLDERGRSPGPLFRAIYHGDGLSPRAVTALVSGLMREAGIKHRAYDGVSAHALRHTAASDVLEHSKDLRAVQQMLGHQSLATTERYLRVADLGRLRAAMAGRTYR
jgi:integrase/recombinase XerC